MTRKKQQLTAKQLFRESETSIKQQIREYLDIKGIYNFPLVQGLGAHRGMPDRIMHFQGGVHYLEVKTPKGKLSEHQQAFQEQCRRDGVPYSVIRSLEDLREIVG